MTNIQKNYEMDKLPELCFVFVQVIFVCDVRFPVSAFFNEFRDECVNFLWMVKPDSFINNLRL